MIEPGVANADRPPSKQKVTQQRWLRAGCSAASHPPDLQNHREVVSCWNAWGVACTPVCGAPCCWAGQSVAGWILSVGRAAPALVEAGCLQVPSAFVHARHHFLPQEQHWLCILMQKEVRISWGEFVPFEDSINESTCILLLKCLLITGDGVVQEVAGRPSKIAHCHIPALLHFPSTCLNLRGLGAGRSETHQSQRHQLINTDLEQFLHGAGSRKKKYR